MPFALQSLFILAMLPLLLAVLAGYFRARQFGNFDNKYPRRQQSQLEGIGARALGAQQNAWEALQIYLVVVFIAYVSGVDLAQLTAVALLFLVLRVLHALCYLADYDRLRSLVFVLGLGCCIYIFILALWRTQPL